jgi:hypothetical protein
MMSTNSLSKVLSIMGFFLKTLFFFACATALLTHFIKGAEWTKENSGAIIQSAINVWIGLFLLAVATALTLGLFRRTRFWAGMALNCLLYPMGFAVWLLSLLFTYTLWGMAPAVIGLLMGGLGIIPVALLATLLKGGLQIHVALIVYTVLTVVVGGLAIRFMNLTSESIGE